jgi:hypothetical protein
MKISPHSADIEDIKNNQYRIDAATITFFIDGKII